MEEQRFHGLVLRKPDKPNSATETNKSGSYSNFTEWSNAVFPLNVFPSHVLALHMFLTHNSTYKSGIHPQPLGFIPECLLWTRLCARHAEHGRSRLQLHCELIGDPEKTPLQTDRYNV